MKGKKERIILGIDPGTIVMGYGLISVSNNKPQFLAMGIIELSKLGDHYLTLKRIFERISGIIEEFLPDDVAIEAPFLGVNAQVMLKLGRAQGVAMIAALSRDIPVTEYSPRRVKQSVGGSGSASKDQVAEMLHRILKIPESVKATKYDATDALAVALCHYFQSSNPLSLGDRVNRNWEDFVRNNPDKVHH